MKRLAAAASAALLISVVLALAPAGPAPLAGAADPPPPLPSLPLPDCNAVGNGGPQFDPEVDCEGTIGGVRRPEGDPAYELTGIDDIAFSGSTRSLDFRTTEDRGGDQVVTFTITSNEPPTYTHTNGHTYRQEVISEWPDYMTSSSIDKRVPGETFGTNGGELRLDRMGTCSRIEPTCSYKVHWNDYDGAQTDRVDRPVIFRVRVDWDVHVYHDRKDGSLIFPYAIGHGSAYFTLRTEPPPPLTVVASVRRLGPAYFEFSAQGTGPNVETLAWSHTSRPTFPAQFSSQEVVFRKDFATDHPNVPPGSSTHVELFVLDRWERAKFASLPITVLAEGGEQVLAISSFEVVGIDGGVATLRAVVQNGSPTAVSNIGLLGSRDPAGTVATDPAVLPSLAPGASSQFTVTVPVEELESFTVEVRASGKGVSGPVQSAPRTTEVEVGDPPTPGTTTLTSASAAGADRIEVASNDGFAPGDYAQVGTGDDAETRRISGIGSLIFSAPLAGAHAAGSPVTEVDPPGGDTTGPVITVTTPAEGGVVVQDEPLTLDYTCTDAGVGIEECGGFGPADGSALPTGTPGPETVSVGAWDTNGNTSTRVVAYTIASRANRSFVRRAVQDLLDRPATTAELDVLGVGLDAGTLTRAGILTTLTTSEEWVSAIVQRFYRDVLGRDGEPAGVAFWTGLIRTGRRSVASVAASFYGSPEYVAGPGGGTADGWVTALYRDLLGREPDAAGLAYWTGVDLPRHTIAFRFFQTRESRAARVEILYQALLRRSADADGLSFWVDRIGTVGDLALARSLAASPEYFALAQET